MLGKKKKEVKISTLLGRGCELKGDFSAKGAARIDGKVEGNVTVTGCLVVGAGASVTGDVSAQEILIGGEILGNVVAPDKAELTATAKVLGDITTAVIVIDEHAVFQGKCDMNQAVPTKKTKSNAAKAVRAGRKSAKAALAEALKEAKAEALEEEQREAQSAEVKAEEKNESSAE